MWKYNNRHFKTKLICRNIYMLSVSTPPIFQNNTESHKGLIIVRALYCYLFSGTKLQFGKIRWDEAGNMKLLLPRGKIDFNGNAFLSM